MPSLSRRNIRSRRASLSVPRKRASFRPLAESLEQRTVLSVTLGTNFPALDFNQGGGYTPPDPTGAAGPSTYVETVNQQIALYDKATGAATASVPLNNFFFGTGGLAQIDSGSIQSDPVVTYDDQIQRYIVGNLDVDFSTHVSAMDIAVSKTSDPSSLNASDWTFYRVVTTEAGYDADFPGNFGFNHDAFVFTLNMFSTRGSGGQTQVVSINTTDLANGVPTPATFKTNLNDFSVRPTTMHDAPAGAPMWLVSEQGNNSSINVIKMSNELSANPTFTYTNLSVNPYGQVVPPLNPDGSQVTNNIDSRILKASEANNTIVAAHTVSQGGTSDVVQWYAIDVSSGTPTLKDQGDVGGGPNTYAYYPSIDINASGQIGLTYMQSGNDTSTDYMSMYVTGRLASDPAGTMQTPVLVAAGTGQANYADFSSGGRAGDLSGISVDPTNGSFWAANEFANTEAYANWGTAVANFSLTSPLPSTDLAVTLSGPASVDVSSGPINLTYTITVSNNGPNPAQGVVLTDLLPAGTSFVSLTQTDGTDGFSTGNSGASATATATGTLASGASDTFQLVVTAPASLGNGDSLNDSVSVLATNPDPNLANNKASAVTSVVNTNTNSDVAVAISAPTKSVEGNYVKYTITVTNIGPSTASGVVLTDTLDKLLAYKSATTTAGTLSQSGGVVTFTIGSIGTGATVTATVIAQGMEDGSASNSAAVTSSTPDSNQLNNTASSVVSFGEAPIWGAFYGIAFSSTVNNAMVAYFRHANGIEPASDFVATINWGDGTTSTGTVSQVGGYYIVRGSHKYTNRSFYHFVHTTVVEAGSQPNTAEKLDKGQNDHPGRGPWNTRDIVKLPAKLVKTHHPRPPRVHHHKG